MASVETASPHIVSSAEEKPHLDHEALLASLADHGVIRLDVNSPTAEQDDLLRREMSARRAEFQFARRQIEPQHPLFVESAAASATISNSPPRRLRIAFVLTAQQVERQCRMFSDLGAVALAAGHEVRIFYVDWVDGKSAAGPQELSIGDRKIPVEAIAAPKIQLVQGLIPGRVENAYNLYEFLKSDPPDVIHSFDYFGVTYYAQVAKLTGVGFTNTHFCIHGTGGHYSLFMSHFQSVSEPTWLVAFNLERGALEMADTLAVPTVETAQAIEQIGYRLDPARLAVTPPWLSSVTNVEVAGKRHPIQQLVLPYSPPLKRNIALMAALVRRLEARGVALPLLTVFLPRERRIEEVQLFAQEQFEGVKTEVSIKMVWGWDDLMRRVRKLKNALLIFPLVENSYPYFEVFDLLRDKIPVIYGRRDVWLPLVARESREAIIAKGYSPDAIAPLLIEALRNGVPSGSLAPDPDTESKRWLHFYDAIAAANPQAATDVSDQQPLVTVALMHFERPHVIDQAIASVEAQTYRNLEVVLVDDGSLSAAALGKLAQLGDAFAAKGWRVVRQDNRYLGAARNTGAQHGRGEYIFFLDDDNVLRPDAIELLVKAAKRTGADFVGSFSNVFRSEETPDPAITETHRIVQVGGDGGYSLFRNGILDGNSLCKRDVYLKLGGNTEHYGIGKDDQEFFLRAVLNGVKTLIVPEGLVWMRRHSTRLRKRHFNRNAGHFRVLDAVPHRLAGFLRPVFFLQQGYFMDDERSEWLIKKAAERRAEGRRQARKKAMISWVLSWPRRVMSRQFGSRTTTSSSYPE